jgi:hypothetical protein
VVEIIPDELLVRYSSIAIDKEKERVDCLISQKIPVCASTQRLLSAKVPYPRKLANGL